MLSTFLKPKGYRGKGQRSVLVLAFRNDKVTFGASSLEVWTPEKQHAPDGLLSLLKSSGGVEKLLYPVLFLCLFPSVDF